MKATVTDNFHYIQLRNYQQNSCVENLNSWITPGEKPYHKVHIICQALWNM